MNQALSHHFSHRHLLGMEGLSKADILLILEHANQHITRNRQKDKKQSTLKGRTLINLFFENSTRTRTSFELAGKRLGADVINMSVSGSSVSKGETLLDTAANLNAMHPDFITVRHHESGAPHLLASKVNCSIINAGDGSHEHPTQALLDALTIQKRRGHFDDLTVTICGDIRHSRVAGSDIIMLNTLGAKVRVCAPPTLLPANIEEMNVEVFHDIKPALDGTNVIMTLRLQQERMAGSFFPSEREYFHLYGLDRKKLAYAADDAFIMDPGPINRGLQIDSELADDLSRSVILDQVEMGVAVRQAILEILAKT